MKKFCKFLIGTISLATAACGVYYFCKKYVFKEANEDFDDLGDEYEEYEAEEDSPSVAESREYVSIHITSEQDLNTTQEQASEIEEDSDENVQNELENENSEEESE